MRNVGGNLRARPVAAILGVLLLLTACVPVFGQEVPPMPLPTPVPAPAPVPPAELPRAAGLEALVPGNAQGVVMIRDVRAFDQKLATTGNRIVPGSFQAREGQQAVQGPIMQGLEELGPMIADGSPLVLLMMIPEGAGESPVAGIMFVPRPGSPLAARPGEGAQEVEELGMFAVTYRNMVIVGEDQRVEQFARAEPGIRMTEPQRLRMDQADAFIFGNFAAMVKSGEASFQQQRQQIQEQIKQMEGAGAEAPMAMVLLPMMRMQLDVMDRFWKVAKQSDWMSAMVQLTDQAADVEMAIAFVGESEIGRFLSNHPPIGEQLAPGLPDVESFAAIWYSLDRQRTVGALTGLLEELIGLQARVQQLMQQQEGQAEAQARLKQQEQQLRQSVAMLKNLDWLEFRGSFAMMSAPQGQQGLRVLQTIRLTDVENWRQRLQQYVEQAQGMSPLGPGAPGEMRLTYEPRQRTVGQMQVDRYTQQLIVPEAPPTDPQERMVMNLLRGLVGPEGRMVSWITESGGYMLAQTAPEPDMLQQMAAALDGGGLGRSERFANLRQYIVPRANVVAFVSLGTVTRGLRNLMMQAEGQEQQQEAAAPAAMTYSAISEAWTEGRAHARMYIPIAELQSATANLMPLIMQMQQGQRRPPAGAMGDDEAF